MSYLRVSIASSRDAKRASRFRLLTRHGRTNCAPKKKPRAGFRACWSKPWA